MFSTFLVKSVLGQDESTIRRINFILPPNLTMSFSTPHLPFRLYLLLIFFMRFCPGTMTTHAESINSDLQRGLDRCLQQTTLNTEQNQQAIKLSADN